MALTRPKNLLFWMLSLQQPQVSHTGWFHQGRMVEGNMVPHHPMLCQADTPVDTRPACRNNHFRNV